MAYDSRLKKALDALADVGVMVVAAAGNNATSRPLLPAAFASFRPASSPGPRRRRRWSAWPLNPDGRVLFSNDGSWTSCHAPAPPWSAPCRRSTSGCDHRSTWATGRPGERAVASAGQLDPDRFTGFGTWSGTSFAAPVMAGAAAQALLEHETFADRKATDLAAAARDPRTRRAAYARFRL